MFGFGKKYPVVNKKELIELDNEADVKLITEGLGMMHKLSYQERLKDERVFFEVCLLEYQDVSLSSAEHSRLRFKRAESILHSTMGNIIMKACDTKSLPTKKDMKHVMKVYPAIEMLKDRAQIMGDFVRVYNIYIDNLKEDKQFLEEGSEMHNLISKMYNNVSG